MNKWQKKIINHTQVDPRTLTPHPDNPRKHTTEEMALFRERVSKQGELDEIKVSIKTRHIINGHMRHQIAVEDGETHVWVTWLDLNPEEELEALFFYDQFAKMAVWDVDKTLEVLDKMPEMEGHSQQLIEQIERDMAGLSTSDLDVSDDDLLNELLDDDDNEDEFSSLGIKGVGAGSKGGDFFKVFLDDTEYEEVYLILKRLGKASGLKEGQNIMIFTAG
jgi:hypothetical protein